MTDVVMRLVKNIYERHFPNIYIFLREIITVTVHIKAASSHLAVPLTERRKTILPVAVPICILVGTMTIPQLVSPAVKYPDGVFFHASAFSKEEFIIGI